MMRRTFKTIVGTVGLVSVIVWSALAADGPDKANRTNTPSLNRTAGAPAYQILNINNLWTWARRDGQSNHAPSGADGMFFPRGTKWVIYQDGLMFGGKAMLDAAYSVPHPSQVVRVGGATYNVGTQAGRVIGSGATAEPANPADADVRIFRIRRDYKQMSDGELTRDAAESFEKLITSVTAGDKAEILAQYEKDWTEWPVALGAPYIERNGTPGYQAPPPFGPNFTVDSLIAQGHQGHDEPGVAGADPNSPADQVVWTVFNDLRPALSLGLYGSEPLGLEIGMTLWGYKRTDAMGNLYFKRYRIINKGGVDIGGGTRGSLYIDSMYVSQWSDPDLGSFGDDLCGVDSAASLAYVYNANAIDNEFRKFNLAPPSAGYDFLAGPIVAAPGDTAVFDFKYRLGFRNLPMSSFVYFSAGSGISDPPFNREGGLRWWKMLRGFIPNASTARDTTYPHPPGEPISFFPLNGDPVRRVGFIDGLNTPWSIGPGDRRFALNSGPFRLAPGDTQEVVVGTVAGLGSDRLSSVSVMKFNNEFVQNTFNALFQVPKPPIAPDVKVTELDGHVVFEWGSNLTRVNETENRVNQPGTYRFEGYNVYQLPSRSSRLSDGRRVATFDLPSDPAVVRERQFDPNSGLILELPVQFGSNSGLQRYFRVNRDYIRDINKMNNGQEYYFVVTAYSIAIDSAYLPAALESDPAVLTVRPQAAKPGLRYAHQYDEKIKLELTAGVTDLRPTMLLIDPARTLDARWKLSFTVDSVLRWGLTNLTTGTLVFQSSNLGSAFSGKPEDDGQFPIISGFQPMVKQLAPDLISDSCRIQTIAGEPYTLGPADSITTVGARYSGGAPAISSGPLARAFTTGLDLGARYLGQFSSSYDHSKLRRIQVRFGPGNQSKAYRVRRTGAGTEYEIQTGVVPVFAPAGEGFVTVPFSAWDMDNVGGPRQLTLSWRDQSNDARWNPPVGGDGVEVVFIHFRTYDSLGRQYRYPTNPDQAGQGPAILNETTVGAGADIMYGMSFTSNGAQISGLPTSVGNFVAYIRPTFTLNSDVVFEFNTTAPTQSTDLAKKDADKVGVYPNPYYAFNPAETSRLVRFVTFNGLPSRATIRIFNLAGHLVRTLDKDDAGQFVRWDLNNHDNFPVASGMYIAHVDMPDLGVSKVLKLAVIQEQEVLDVF